MPELPEVETIRMGLEKYLVGHKIINVQIKTTKVFSGDKKLIEGSKIISVQRFAKVLSINLSGGYSLVVHVKLTGQLIYRGPNLKNPPGLSEKVLGLPGKHTHVIIELDRGGHLYYNDVRKFGWIKVIKTNEVAKSGFIGKLGPEPFKDLTLQKFKLIISKFKTPIKIVLMDQEKIGGVGNIYANDTLWLAKVHPKRPASSLTSSEQSKLYDSLLTVLKNGLKYGGASELSFVTAEGGEGGYQEHFLAYGKTGEVCERCHKAHFEKITLGGRGTYYCPICQK
jgi:formamidopyrimidine-DNA glycosylase